MSKHTPTPWRYVSRNRYGVIGLKNRIQFEIGPAPEGTRSGAPIADICDQPNAEANADHIVHCVNTYPDLVKALEDMASAFQPFTMKQIGLEGSSARLEQETQNAAHKAARAALAKAKVKS